jgi:hypothetical protein
VVLEDPARHLPLGFVKRIMGNMQHLMGATNAMFRCRLGCGLGYHNGIGLLRRHFRRANEKVLANVGLDHYFEAAGFTFDK